MANWLGILRPRNLLRDFLGRIDKDNFHQAGAESVRTLLNGTCPWCDTNLSAHSYALLSAVAAAGPSAQVLIGHLKREDWLACRNLLELAIDTDSIEVLLLRCPTAQVRWILRKVPYEYLFPQGLIALDRVSDHGRQNLKASADQLKLTWLPLDPLPE